MKKLFFLFAILVSLNALAQNDGPNLDSLNQVWLNKSNPDTARFSALRSIIIEKFRYDHVDTALSLISQMCELAVNTNNVLLEARATSFYAYILFANNKEQEAIPYYIKSLNLYFKTELTPQTRELIAAVYSNLGMTYSYRDEYDSAIYYYGLAIEQYKAYGNYEMAHVKYRTVALVNTKNGNSQKAIDAYTMAGEYALANKDSINWVKDYKFTAGAYMNMGMSSQALKIYEDVLDWFIKNGDSKEIASSLADIAWVYSTAGLKEKALAKYKQAAYVLDTVELSTKHAHILNNIGSIFSNLNNYDSALVYFDSCMSVASKLGSVQYKAVANRSLGYAHTKLKNYSKADSCFNRSLEAYITNNVKGGVPNILTGLSQLYNKQGKLELAQTYGVKALKLAKGLKKVMAIKDASEVLVGIYEKQNKGMQALEMHRLYIQMRDSLQSGEVAKQLAQTESRAAFEKELLIKEQEEKEAALAIAVKAERRNSLEYSGITMALFLLFGLVFFIGHFSLPNWAIEFLIFLPILVLFEFVLVLTDPFVETYAGGDPMVKLLINAVIAGFIFPLHSFFERVLKNRLIKPNEVQ